MLGNEYTLTYFKQLLGVRKLLVHHSLRHSIKYDSNKSTYGEHDRRIQPHYRQLQGTSKEWSNNFLIVYEHHKVLLILNLFLGHLGFIFLPQFFLNFTGALFPFFGFIFIFDFFLGVSRVEDTRSVTEIGGVVFATTAVGGTQGEGPVVDAVALSVELKFHAGKLRGVGLKLCNTQRINLRLRI